MWIQLVQFLLDAIVLSHPDCVLRYQTMDRIRSSVALTKRRQNFTVGCSGAQSPT